MPDELAAEERGRYRLISTKTPVANAHAHSASVPIRLPFAPLFTAPTSHHVKTLLLGTLLAEGPRTVTAPCG